MIKNFPHAPPKSNSPYQKTSMRCRDRIPIGCTKPKEFTRKCVMIMHENERPHNAYRYMYVQKYSRVVAGYMSMTLP